MSRRSLDLFAAGADYHRPMLDEWLPEAGIVMDVGCGLGRVVGYYHRQDRPVIGVDIDIDALIELRSLTDAPLVVADARRLPFATGGVSAVVGLGIVEIDPPVILAEITRVVQPEGLVYLSLPAARPLLRSSTQWRGVPIRRFDKASIRHLLGEHGLRLAFLRRTSIAAGLGQLGRLAGLAPALLIREDRAALSYRLVAPALRWLSNSFTVVARHHATRTPTPTAVET